MQIRKYQSLDQPQLIRIFRLNTPTYFALEEEKDFKTYLDRYSENYFVIEKQNEIVGCGGFNISEAEKIAFISWDLLHPNNHGQGLGTALVNFRINKIRQNKVITSLHVRTSQLAFKFYEKSGFVLHKKEKDFWAPEFDLYHMILKLN